MSNQSLREAGQQALECKRLAHDYASACAGCDPEDFAAKERDEMYAAIDKLARLARPAEHGTLKDHEIAATVNRLRDIAVEFYGSQQLRERIARIVVPLLSSAEQGAELSDEEIDKKVASISRISAGK